MKLIVDANELFSAIIAKGRGRDTKKLEILFSDKVELFAPVKLFYEMEKYAEEIKAKAGFSDLDFDVFVGILKLRIKSILTEEFADKLLEAKKICLDEKDVPYIALALKLNCPIWSGDKKLKEQRKVKVYNTKELVEEFGL